MGLLRFASDGEGTELRALRAKLLKMEQVKSAGYRKLPDAHCGGRPVDPRAPRVDAEGLDINGCRVMRAQASASELSRHAAVNTSSAQERASNLVDGTESEWWTHEGTAVITVDLGRVAHITELKLHWWGTSYADTLRVTVSVDARSWSEVRHLDNYALDDSQCRLRAIRGECVTHTDSMMMYCRHSCSGASPSPEGEPGKRPRSASTNDPYPKYNGWTSLPGWALETRLVKIELSHGHADPWGMQRHLGLRRIEVYGVADWEPCAIPGQMCNCFGSVRIWQQQQASWTTRGASGEVECSPRGFGLFAGLATGTCHCRHAAREEEALELCRHACDGIGNACGAFEYKFQTDANLQSLGPQCCFRTALRDIPEPGTVAQSDCYQKVL